MIIEIKNIYKNYYKNNKKIKVLENIDYKFKKGKFYCISGKSGSGKSTLIKILGLMLSPDKGMININGENIVNISENERCELRNKKIGFIFQNYYLNQYMTVKENIELPMHINKAVNKDKKVNELMKMLDIIDRKDHFPKELSGGEQQRVAICRALANDPSLILADEPTGSLDYENEEKILAILKKLAKSGKCVIVVSHNPRTKQYADVNLKIVNHLLVEDLNEK